MSAPVNRQPEGTPAGGQFAASAHSEAEGVILTAVPAAECDDYGSDLEDGVCPDCTCSCGASLNDGEGYDGLCGNCADADEDDDDDDEPEQIFDMQLRDASGEYLDFSVNRLGDSHYEVEDEDGTQIAEFHHLGDDEDHNEIQDSAIEAMKAAGHAVSDD
ncbi:hypothetical protein [Arthrobacter sp. Z1-15]